MKGKVEMEILGVPLGNKNGGGEGKYRSPTWVPTKYGGCGVLGERRLWLVKGQQRIEMS